MFGIVCLALIALAQGMTTPPHHTPLEDVVENLANQVAALTAKIDAMGGGHRRVAFSAELGGSANLHAVDNTVIVWETLIDNVGNAYDPTNGHFTAPFDGDYFFIIDSDVSPDYQGMLGYLNGLLKFKADKDDWSSTHVSGHVVLKMVAGDVFYIKHSTSRGSVDHGPDAVYSGFLIN